MREKMLAKVREQRQAPKRLPIEFLGEDLWIRKLSGAERDDYESSMVTLRGKQRTVNLHNLRARLVVLVLVDAEGQRVFADADAAELGTVDGDELDRVYEAASRFNGLNKEAFEEIEKN